MSEHIEHYFSERQEVASDEREVVIDLVKPPIVLRTDRGVFSHGKVDTGTALLLREAPTPPPTGNFLDLGCGAGAIALTLARRSPSGRVIAVDINERARYLCAGNGVRNGLGNVEVHAPVDVDEQLRFDLIWSNPPIRIGKTPLHDLLARWLGRLQPTGTAVLVVQRHLGADSLQRWLGDRGWPTDRLASSKGYRLLQVGPSHTGRVDDDANP